MFSNKKIWNFALIFILFFHIIPNTVWADNYFSQILNGISPEANNLEIKPLERLLNRIQFGAQDYEIRAGEAQRNDYQFSTNKIDSLNTNLEPRLGYGPCGTSPNLACRQDFFIACAQSYKSDGVSPLQCSNFTPAEYANLDEFYYKNPDAEVEDYFSQNNKFNLINQIEYDNETPLKDIFQTRLGGSSGWGTWFGLSPEGKRDGLAGTAQYRGYTGFCNQYNNNPGCYNVYNKNTCIVSLPKSTMNDFYGNLSRDEMRKLIDNKPMIEVRNTANGKCTVAPLGDVGPGESTGKKIDMTGCIMAELGGRGLIHTHMRPLKKEEAGCTDKKEFPVGGIVEATVNCNCNSKDVFKAVLISDPLNRKRLKGIFEIENNINLTPGKEILARYKQIGNKICATRPNPKSNICDTKTKGVSGNLYDYKIVGGKIIDFGQSKSKEIVI